MTDSQSTVTSQVTPVPLVHDKDLEQGTSTQAMTRGRFRHFVNGKIGKHQASNSPLDRLAI